MVLIVSARFRVAIVLGFLVSSWLVVLLMVMLYSGWVRLRLVTGLRCVFWVLMTMMIGFLGELVGMRR